MTRVASAAHDASPDEQTRMRTEVAGQNGASQIIVFDGGKQILYIIDPAAKSYSEMTKADVDAAGAGGAGNRAGVARR